VQFQAKGKMLVVNRTFVVFEDAVEMSKAKESKKKKTRVRQESTTTKQLQMASF
jgi:hypothetical protein